MKNITFVPSSVKRTKPDKALVTFKIASEDFSNIEKGLYKQYKRQIKVPGFRAGKIPDSMLKKYIDEESLFEEAVQTVWKNSAESTIEQNNLHAIALQSIKNKKTKTGVDIFVEIEVLPEINVDFVDKLNYKFSKPDEVTDAAVDSELSKIVSAESQFLPAEKIQEGDYVRMEGVFSSGEVEEKVERAFEINAKTLPSKSFMDKLIGKNQNDELSFKSKFSKAYSNPDLGGKMVNAKIKITSVKRETIPVISDLCAKYGIKDEDEFKTRIKSNLMIQNEDKAFAEANEKLPQILMKKVKDFSVPQVLIDEEKQLEWNNYVKNNTDENKKTEIEDWWKESEKGILENIKLGIVVDAIGDKKGIQVLNHEIEYFFRDIASQVRRPVKKIIQESKRNGNLPIIARNIRRAKVRNSIIKEFWDRQESKK